jgi:hypothetical protein
MSLWNSPYYIFCTRLDFHVTLESEANKDLTFYSYMAEMLE